MKEISEKTVLEKANLEQPEEVLKETSLEQIKSLYGIKVFKHITI